VAQDSQHPRPFDRGFYERARSLAAAAPAAERVDFDEPGPLVVDVPAGSAVRVELTSGAQIVNLLPVNRHDPDERLWAHETCLVDGLWIRRWSRLWGTMARFRPLLTCLEDSVVLIRRPGEEGAQHHPVLGGSGSPAEWRWAGGDPAALTTWEQYAAALSARDLPHSLITDNACLFQKTQVDAYAQRLNILASDARRGDHVVFLAEIDLTLLLALSPYVDGSRLAAELHGVGPNPVRVSVTAPLVEPLAWPAPDMGYPDLSLYLDATGTRSPVAGPTPGRESPA
jgi:uncharacterized protein YcgI (DUF1989 family)